MVILRTTSFALLAALCSVAFLLSPPLAAEGAEPYIYLQSPADTVEAQLPEVIVQATRDLQPYEALPFSYALEVVPPQVVGMTPRFTISEALEHLPGIQIDNRGHFALGERVSVRGIGRQAPFGTRGVNVVLDGIPMTMPDGQAVLEAVEPSLIRRAELLRGPSSLFWGNASGGALLLFTEPPGRELNLRARAAGGSFERQQFRLEGNAPIGDGTLHSFASYAAQDGFREHSAGYRARAGLNTHVPLTPFTHLRVTGAFVDQDTEHPGSLTREEMEHQPDQARDLFAQAGAGKWSTQGQLGASLSHELVIGTFTGTVYGIMRSLDNPLPFVYVDLNRTAGGVRLSLEHDLEWIHWNIGLDASTQRDDRKNFDTVDGRAGGDLRLDQLETVTDAGLFGSLRIPVTHRLYLQGGLRLDAVQFEAEDRLQVEGEDLSGSRNYRAWSPAAGVSYELGPTRVYGNYRTAFETPTTTELVNRPDLEGGFNPDIQPQRVHGFEAGWRGTVMPGFLEFDATAYRLLVQDRIVSFRTEAGGGRDFFRNAGLTTHDGFELTTNWHVLEQLRLFLSYSFSHYIYREEELDGNHVPGVPPHHVFAIAQGGFGNVWGRMRTELASPTYVNDANDEESEAYAVVDLQVGYEPLRLAGARIAPFASIDNIFDQHYSGSITVNDAGRRFYEPAPGRSFTIGVNVEI